ncbi:N-acetylmuramoyl-L-alanine amidase family protein [Acetivibrio mesophilus]|uniref:N-acetylmuramoyl-L-alanine amidase n=1 Tax=Acetivibrio mesophilus TaxID=2487273 RepID=A0A4V1K2D0_9FIRM|nr:N-acetylmuramoyl-L-alanine amidase [Acetivibrio mesophilus]RXE59859.1 N-acetylmuramoyl-L-alanine amidase [Acetivibrio mesophilus]
MNIKAFLMKIRRFYLRLPLRMKIIILAVVFAILAVGGIGVYNRELSMGPKDSNDYLGENGNKTAINPGNIGGIGNIDEPKPKEVIVVIDPGHGGEDLGAYNGILYEKDINLDISLKLGKLLEDMGIEVVYTRKTDVFVDLEPRVDLANKLEATLFISVHSNSMPDNSEYRGTETLYCPSLNPKYSKMDGRKLAIIVQKELVKTLGTVDNGIIERPNLAVLRKTMMPAVIAEIAYISNPSDRAKLSDDAFRKKSAQALANAVINALDEMGAVKDENGTYTIIED